MDFLDGILGNIDSAVGSGVARRQDLYDERVVVHTPGMTEEDRAEAAGRKRSNEASGTAALDRGTGVSGFAETLDPASKLAFLSATAAAEEMGEYPGYAGSGGVDGDSLVKHAVIDVAKAAAKGSTPERPLTLAMVPLIEQAGFFKVLVVFDRPQTVPPDAERDASGFQPDYTGLHAFYTQMVEGRTVSDNYARATKRHKTLKDVDAGTAAALPAPVDSLYDRVALAEELAALVRLGGGADLDKRVLSQMPIEYSWGA